MSKIRRIDQLFNLNPTNDNKTGEKRKKKVPSQPPRSDKELRDIIDDIFMRNRSLANCLMMQALTGLRFSDCSQLMYSDFYRNGVFVDRFEVIQQKTFGSRVTKRIKGKELTNEQHQEIMRKAALEATVIVYTNESVKMLVEACHRENPKTEYLFANKNPKSKGYPIDIRNAEYHLRKTEANLELNYQLRTHSFRKGFAMKMVDNQVSLVIVRDLLGHSNFEATNRYLSTIGSEMMAAVNQLRYD
ncbi:tyrosine-type recombinase/integrase [Vibrio splendidus]|nr:tyrosine-type recombinase/integrase [Vibrio splendidus]MCC4880333.1 site-specific integrase [Vibrio splendidus]